MQNRVPSRDSNLVTVTKKYVASSRFLQTGSIADW